MGIRIEEIGILSVMKKHIFNNGKKKITPMYASAKSASIRVHRLGIKNHSNVRIRVIRVNPRNQRS